MSPKMRTYALLGAMSLALTACDVQTPVSETSISNEIQQQEVQSLAKPQAAEDYIASGGRVECLSQRFVVPPKGKDKKAPKFRFAQKYKDLVDPMSLAVALNERDIDCSFDHETGEIRFTNPGKSRAVIDVSYCVYFPGEGEGGGDDGNTTGGDDGNTTGGDDGSTTGGNDGGTTSGDDGGDNGGVPTDDILYTGGVVAD